MLKSEELLSFTETPFTEHTHIHGHTVSIQASGTFKRNKIGFLLGRLKSGFAFVS